MKLLRKWINGGLCLLATWSAGSVFSQSYSEGFENLANLTDWYIQNNSVLPDQEWGAGDATVFPAQAGPSDSYLSVNYQSSSSSSATTLSNWLFTPTRTYNNGDVITFYTRTVAGTPVYPDRLEVRLSTAGNELDCGTTATSVGTFTSLLLTINPTLSTTAYPQTWTQYTISISGLSGPTNGRVAFRYFVENGGPGGANSNYIGIDSYTYTSVVAPPVNDECSGATTLTQGNGCTPVSGTVAYATESLVACSGTANNDVWYSFTASTTGAAITVNGTPFFDAVYEVYSGNCANLTSLTCVDAGFEGETESNVLNGLFPGTTYYIRVHDWLDDIPNTMNFGICVEQFTQCNLSQPGGVISESEICGSDANGGCNVSTPAFQFLSCGDTVYGNAWATNGNRDLDWYSFQVNAAGNVVWSATSEFPFNLYIVDISSCSNPVILATSNFNACQTGSITYPLSAQGNYAVVIAPSTFEGYPCGANSSYLASLQLIGSMLQVNASSTNFCAGDSVLLSVNGGSNYSWLLGDSVVSTDVAWHTNDFGSYVVQYVDLNGCDAVSDTLTLTQLPLSDASFSYLNNTVCAGSDNTIPTTLESGIFSVTPNGLSIDLLTGEINIVNSSVGTYTLTFQTNQGCVNSSSQLFTITNSLSASFNYDTTHFCNSEGIELISLGSLASTGVFSSTTGLSLDSLTGAIFPNISQNGNYWVINSVEGTTLCSGAEDSVFITIQGPQIQMQNTVEACSESSPILLEATPEGGVFNGQGVVNDTWFPLDSSGIVMITYSVVDSIGCFAIDSIQAITFQSPIVSLGSIEALCDTIGFYSLNNFSPQGGTFSGNGISGNGSLNPSQLGQGTYPILYTVTSSDGCIGLDSTNIVIVDCEVGVSELNAFQVMLFPNPNNGEFYVKARDFSSIKCINTIGSDLKFNLAKLDNELYQLNLHEPPGAYFIEIMFKSGKLIIPVRLY